MAKLNKDGYSLQYCLEHSEYIHNGKHVYNLLHESGIDNWNDLVNMYQYGYLPNPQIKGIGKKTWPVIIRMAEKEEFYRRPNGLRALKNAIDAMTIGCEYDQKRNSYDKILNILRRNHIYTLEQLWGAPDDYIRNIRNFGPRLLSIVNTIRQNETGSHIEHYEAFMKEYEFWCGLEAQFKDSSRKRKAAV